MRGRRSTSLPMSRNKIRLNELTQAIDQYADEAFEAGGEYERGRITRGIHAAAVKADELGKEAHRPSGASAR